MREAIPLGSAGDLRTELNLQKLLNKRMLVTRQTAREIAPEVQDALLKGNGGLVLDFSDVAGISPSFLSETILVVEDCVQKIGEPSFRVVMENPPTKLSRKFVVLGKAHGVDIREGEGKTWIITKSGV